MAFDIRLLSSITLEKRLYLFDSNLWIKILKPPTELSAFDEKYLTFFKTFSTSPIKPKIALPALVLSEVINRLLREVGMQTYIKANPALESLYQQDTKGFYKKHYRSSQAFSDYYKSILSDLSAFQDSFTLIDDGFNTRINATPIMDNPIPKLDFNDNYYFNLAKTDDMPVVTDDIDFFVDEITVYTYNNKLYKKGTDSIVPKFNK